MVSAVSLLLGLATLFPHAEGHGYMEKPLTIRRKNGKFRYELQSLGAVGPGGDITVCGRDGAENFKSGDIVTKLPAPGSTYTINARITAHHYGHMIVRVCKYIDGGTRHEDLKNCIRLKDKKGKTVWPLSQNTGLKKWEVVLPTKKELLALGTNKFEGVYTIQWRWNTANSCKASDNVEDEKSNCNERKCCSEVFTNCADVVFSGLPSKPPTPAKDPPTTPPPPSGGGSNSDGGSSGGAGCVREDDCSKSGWCKDPVYEKWCKQFGAGKCKDYEQCRWADAGSDGQDGAQPEPEPQGEPPSKHVVVITEAAKASPLRKVQEFCSANKKFFCDPLSDNTLGHELCECEPVDVHPEPEPEPEPKPGGGSIKEKCASFKAWCQSKCNNRAAASSVGINQCYGTGPTMACKCKVGKEYKEITKSYVGLLELDDVDMTTKLSDHITRHVGAHGEIDEP